MATKNIIPCSDYLLHIRWERVLRILGTGKDLTLSQNHSNNTLKTRLFCESETRINCMEKCSYACFAAVVQSRDTITIRRKRVKTVLPSLLSDSRDPRKNWVLDHSRVKPEI